MYTPINKFKLKAEGKRVFSDCENLIKNQFFNTGIPHKIYLKKKHFDLLMEGVMQDEKYKDGIPFWNHLIVVAGN